VSAFVIIVDFKLKADTRAAFRKLIDRNATDSCKHEPGCQRFDVLEQDGEPDRIVLYEIYDDEAAFKEHIKTKHFAVFDRDSAEFVTDKKVTAFKLVCEGSSAAKA
jgi:(4S)-4-hydroxy-5-phosphonooxypentane-2,3-dione isomerase